MYVVFLSVAQSYAYLECRASVVARSERSESGRLTNLALHAFVPSLCLPLIRKLCRQFVVVATYSETSECCRRLNDCVGMELYERKCRGRRSSGLRRAEVVSSQGVVDSVTWLAVKVGVNQAGLCHGKRQISDKALGWKEPCQR